jgi:hypothetical protein
MWKRELDYMHYALFIIIHQKTTRTKRQNPSHATTKILKLTSMNYLFVFAFSSLTPVIPVIPHTFHIPLTPTNRYESARVFSVQNFAIPKISESCIHLAFN